MTISSASLSHLFIFQYLHTFDFCIFFIILFFISFLLIFFELDINEKFHYKKYKIIFAIFTTNFFALLALFELTAHILALQNKLDSINPHISLILLFIALSLFYALAYMDFRNLRVYALINILFFIISFLFFILDSLNLYFNIFVFFIISLCVMIFYFLSNIKSQKLGQGDIFALISSISIVLKLTNDYLYIGYFLTISSIIAIIYFFAIKNSKIPFITALFVGLIVQTLWNIND